MSTATLTIKVDGKSAERDFKRLENQLDRLEKEGNKVERQFGALGKKAKIAAAAGIAALGVALIKSVKLSIEFQKSMAEISTLLSGDVKGSMEELTEGVRELSIAYGGDVNTNAQALYSIISAGASDSAEAVKILDVANKLAIGGVTDVATAADGLTSALNAYGASADEAEGYSDAMFVAMKAGKTTIGELSAGLGQVAPLASQVGVSFEEMLASTSAITSAGVATTEAFTQVRSVLVGVIKPSDSASKAAKRMGIDFSTTALKSKGLKVFLEEIAEATGGSADEMAKLFPRVEGLSAALALTGNQAKQFSDNMEAMNKKAGATNEAFEKMKATVAFEWGRFTAHMKDWGIAIGNFVLPAIQKALNGLNKLLDLIEGPSDPTAFEKTQQEINKLSEVALDSMNAMAKLRLEFKKGEIGALEYNALMRNLEGAYKRAKAEIAGLNIELKDNSAAMKEVSKDLDALLKGELFVGKEVKKVTSGMNKQTKATKRKKTETEKLTDRLVAMGVGEKDLSKEMIDLDTALEKGIITFDQYADKVMVADKATKEIAKTTKAEVSVMGKIWENFTENTQRAFGDLIYDNMKSILEDGKLTFKSFTDTILDMFLRMLAEMAAAWATKGILSLFGNAAGGGLGGALSGILGGGGGGGLGGIVSGALGGISKMFTGIGVAAKGAWATISGGATSAFATVKTGASAALSGVSSGFTGMLAAVAPWAPAIMAGGILLKSIFGKSGSEKRVDAARDEFNAYRDQLTLTQEAMIPLNDTVRVFGDTAVGTFLQVDESVAGGVDKLHVMGLAVDSVGGRLTTFWNENGKLAVKLTGNIEAAKDVLMQFGTEGSSALQEIRDFTIQDASEFESFKNIVEAMGGVINSVESEWGVYSGDVTGSLGLMIALQNAYSDSMYNSIGAARSLAGAVGSIPSAPTIGATPQVGFAHGGSFLVGGSGGTDTTPVSFMATRKERVTIETPEQQREGSNSQPININVTVDGEGLDKIIRVTADDHRVRVNQSGIRADERVY